MNNMIMRTAILAALSLGLVTLFQNCAKEVQVEKYTTNSSTGTNTDVDGGGVYDPPLPPQLEPPVVTSPLQATYLSIQYDNLATMGVNATGEGTLSYKWYKNNIEISGETSENLVIGNARESDGATYKAMVTSSNGLWVYSPEFHLSIIRLDSQYPPAVSVTPINPTINYFFCYHDIPDLVLTANITNNPVVGKTYKWFRTLSGKSEEPLTETSNKLTIKGTDLSWGQSNGSYRVMVTNDYGTGNSSTYVKLNTVYDNCN